MKQFVRPIFCALVLMACTLSQNVNAAAGEDEVRKIVSERDAEFWKAYNNCDTERMKEFFTQDVEFYHDKGGVTLGLDALMDTIKKNLCGGSTRLRREIVPGLFKVSVLKKGEEVYGAIVSGEHVFYVKEGDKAEFLDGRANYANLWLKKDGVFKMTRIFSYDHRPAKEEAKR